MGKPVIRRKTRNWGHAFWNGRQRTCAQRTSASTDPGSGLKLFRKVLALAPCCCSIPSEGLRSVRENRKEGYLSGRELLIFEFANGPA
jgi:hypothetical protein